LANRFANQRGYEDSTTGSPSTPASGDAHVAHIHPLSMELRPRLSGARPRPTHSMLLEAGVEANIRLGRFARCYYTHMMYVHNIILLEVFPYLSYVLVLLYTCLLFGHIPAGRVRLEISSASCICIAHNLGWKILTVLPPSYRVLVCSTNSVALSFKPIFFYRGHKTLERIIVRRYRIHK
jgi:hypothetical protein